MVTHKHINCPHIQIRVANLNLRIGLFCLAPGAAFHLKEYYLGLILPTLFWFCQVDFLAFHTLRKRKVNIAKYIN
jgi:hypothetical protein